MKLCAFDDQKELAKEVGAHLGASVIFPKITQFADGEIRISFDHPEQIENEKIVILQSTHAPHHEHLMHIILAAHELKNASAKEVVAVIPYFGYARQEKSDIPGKPGPAAAVIHMLESAGIDALMTVQVHEPFIKEFCSVPFYNISMVDVIAEHINEHFSAIKQDLCLIAPDKGAETLVFSIAQLLGVGTIVYAKERFGVDETRIVGRTGECLGKTAIIIDDIIATGGTALNVAAELMSKQFTNVYGYFVHPVLAGNVLERLAVAPFNEIFVCNTIPVRMESNLIPLRVIDISKKLAMTIEQLV